MVNHARHENADPVLAKRLPGLGSLARLNVL
jgi:hypothetical protein